MVRKFTNLDIFKEKVFLVCGHNSSLLRMLLERVKGTTVRNLSCGKHATKYFHPFFISKKEVQSQEIYFSFVLNTMSFIIAYIFLLGKKSYPLSYFLPRCFKFYGYLSGRKLLSQKLLTRFCKKKMLQRKLAKKDGMQKQGTYTFFRFFHLLQKNIANLEKYMCTYLCKKILLRSKLFLSKQKYTFGPLSSLLWWWRGERYASTTAA